MNKRIFLALVLAAFMTLGGCGGNAGNNSSGEDTGADEYHLTEEEIRILHEAYGSDAILEGSLYPHQEIGLEQLRAGVSSLHEKYPSYTFRVVYFEPENVYNGKATISFVDDNDNLHTVMIWTAEGGYECEDDYYGEIIGDDYDAYLRDTFQAEGIDVICSTNFSEPVGDSFDENLTLEKTMDRKPPVTRVTYLFVYNLQSMELVERVVQDNQLYGAYIVYYVADADGRDRDVLVANRKKFESETFNCFYEQ